MHVKTVAIAVCGALLAGCGSSSHPASVPTAPQRISLHSSAFAANSAIPRRYTCDGAGSTPPLAWSGVPAGAKELALLVQDPDAPGGTFTHWVAYEMPASATSPSGARQGRNSAGKTGWTPPCPPRGSKPHHYVFTLLALSKPLALPAGASASEVESKAAGATLAEGRLVGLYSR